MSHHSNCDRARVLSSGDEVLTSPGSLLSLPLLNYAVRANGVTVLTGAHVERRRLTGISPTTPPLNSHVIRDLPDPKKSG
jgi:hypothetical protein